MDKRVNKKKKSWLCECDCGNQTIVTTSELVNNIRTQCRDCGIKQSGQSKRNKWIGCKFGMLTVVDTYSIVTKSGKHRTICKCKCDCGNIVERKIDHLKRYKDDPLYSCGCTREEKNNLRAKNVIGQQFERLLVLDEFKENGIRKLRCKCDCGNEVVITKSDVLSGHTKSCGCYHSDITSEKSKKDWTGFVSNYGIKIMKPSHKNSLGQWLWECECHCGNHFVTYPKWIANGHTTSCGCRKQSAREELVNNYLTRHNINFEREYMIDECRYINPLKFDFVIFKDSNEHSDKYDNIDYIIETDGIQHRKPIQIFGGQEEFERTKERDQIKNNFCKENNIPLYRFSDLLSDQEVLTQLSNIIYP